MSRYLHILTLYKHPQFYTTKYTTPSCVLYAEEKRE